jgi:uncharacterized membrane protein
VRAVAIAFAVSLIAACGSSTPLPCDVDRVLVETCQLCHAANPAFGAPMSLVDWEDTQATTPSADRPVWQQMQRRIDDPVMPMPPGGTTELTAADRAILADWFAAGAPPRAEGAECP